MEDFMCAIQDQAVNCKNYTKFIIKDGTVDELSRQCNLTVENIQHTVSRCHTLTQLDSKDRHDNAAKILHEKLALEHSTERKDTLL
jgi:preprotein translocase subunit Sec63